MSLDPISISAFRDEAEKIAYVRQAVKAGIGLLRAGAKVTGNAGAKATADAAKAAKASRFAAREAAFTKNLARKPGEGAIAHTVRKGWSDVGGAHGSRGGWFGAKDTWREKLPVGGKTMAAAFTAASVPGAVKKEDPMGRGRSRGERLAQLGAGTLGGIAGVGALMRNKPIGLLRSVVGGAGGAMAAEHAASLPFRRARVERMQGGPLSRDDRSQLMQQAKQRPTGAR